MDFMPLAQECAASVHPTTLAALVRQESGFNPYAIGVVGGRLARQPRNKDEAVATARALEKAGWNFSLGLGQVNRYNLAKYSLTYETAFDPCPNLRASAAILVDCFLRALPRHQNDKQAALDSALSCYYSGNFTTGISTGYVRSVKSNAAAPILNVKYVSASNRGELAANISETR